LWEEDRPLNHLGQKAGCVLLKDESGEERKYLKTSEKPLAKTKGFWRGKENIRWKQSFRMGFSMERKAVSEPRSQ